MKKNSVLKSIHELPDEFDLETIVEKLILMDKVEKGLEQVKGKKQFLMRK